MKKINIVLTSLLLSAASYGITLDEMIKEVELNGYSREFKGLETRKLEVEETKIDLIDRDGVEIDADSTYLSSDKADEFDTSINANYDYFAYKGSYDHENGETNRELIGVEKELKDLFYSDREFNQNLFALEEERRLALEEDLIEEEVINLISLYKEYMDSLLELELLKELHPNIVIDYETLKKQFELGVAQEVDYLLSEVRLENSLANIEQLEHDLVRLKEEFNLIYKINVENKEIAVSDYSLVPTFEDYNKIGSRELNIKLLEIEESKEELSYSRYDEKWPDITAGTYYDNVNDGLLVSLGISKSLFEYDDTSELLEVDIEELSLEQARLEKEVINTQNNLRNSYISAKKSKDNLEKLNRIEAMEKDIFKLRYEQGTSSYMDYVEEYDEYIESSIDLEKAKNNLNALAYEIKYRR